MIKVPCKTNLPDGRSGNDKFPYSVGDRPSGNVEIYVRKAGHLSDRNVTVIEDGRLVEKVVKLPSGDIVKRVIGDNLVLNRAKTQMSHLFVGHQATTRYVNRMVFGTGGHQPGDTSSPINPTPDDTQLDSSILTKALSSFVFESTTSVTCIAFVLEGEGNGFTITESGLLCGDNTLAARRTFGGLSKTSDFVFEFRHTILF
jgi:hypothetical protein